MSSNDENDSQLNSIDDADFWADLERQGIVRKPGMAAEMMGKLAPLLLAEGIDLDNLDESVDLDTLNHEMGKAIERYNMELFTPVGAHRQSALETLLKFVQLLAKEQIEDAFGVVGSIPIEPGKRQAAISHVIGVALGLVDEWYADPEYAQVLLQARPPKIEGVSRSAARAIMQSAQVHNASSTDSAIMRYGDKAVLEGAMLAVVAAVQTVADLYEEPILTTARRLILGQGQRKSPKGSAFGNAYRGTFGNVFGSSLGAGSAGPAGGQKGAGRSGVIGVYGLPFPPNALVALRGFREWMKAASLFDNDVDLGLVTVFKVFLTAAYEDGIDLCEPQEIGFGIDLAFSAWDAPDPESVEAVTMVLHSLDGFVTSRFVEEGQREKWEEALDLVGDAISQIEGVEASNRARELRRRIAERDAGLDPEMVRIAVTRSPIAAAVAPFLDWLGASKPVTGTGSLRRVDLAPVGALLGLNVVGVAKESDYEFLDRSLSPKKRMELRRTKPTYVKSMWDVRALAAWWFAMENAGIIEVGKTRVRPGANADKWSEGVDPSVEDAKALFEDFALQFFASGMDPDQTYSSMGVTLAAINLLQSALSDDDESDAALSGGASEEHAAPQGIDWGREHSALWDLADVGFLEPDEQGVLIVSPGLRAPVLRGVVSALELSEGPLGALA